MFCWCVIPEIVASVPMQSTNSVNKPHEALFVHVLKLRIKARMEVKQFLSDESTTIAHLLGLD